MNTNSEIEARIKKLRDILNEQSYKYYVLNAPDISDIEFDKLMNELKTLEETYPEFYDVNSPTVRVGSDITNTFEQVRNFTNSIKGYEKKLLPPFNMYAN